MTGEPSGSGLRSAAITGVRWTAFSRFVAEGLAFAAAVVLARLIPPAEFGHTAIAVVVTGLAAVVGSAGVTAPVIQRRELGERYLRAAGFLALGCGVAGSVLVLVFSKTLAPVIFDDRTADLIGVASPAWILVAIGAVAQAQLQRELRFRRLALVETTAVVAGTATSVSLALAGVNGEAIVIGGLVLVGVVALLSLVSVPFEAPRPFRPELGEIATFAAPVAGSSFVYLSYRNVDYVILGAQAPAAQVGYYWRGYQLGVDYQSKITRVLGRLALPLYSRTRDMEQLRRVRLRILRAQASLLIPILATFIGVAPVLVPWLFGPEWEPAVRPAQIMAVAGMADAITTGVGPLMVAVGRPGALLRWNLLQLACYATLVAILAPHGIIAVAIGVAGFGVFNVVGIQIVLLRRHVGLSFAQLWHDIRAGLVTGVAILALVLGAREALDGTGLPVFPTLVVLGAVAVGTYVAVLRLAFRDVWVDVTAVVRRRAKVSENRG